MYQRISLFFCMLMATMDIAACSYCMLTSIMDAGPQAPSVSTCQVEERAAIETDMGLPVACCLSTIFLVAAVAIANDAAPAVPEVAGLGLSKRHSKLLTAVL